MPNKSPALVQVTTASTGFGPYQLTNDVPEPTGYRSIANAVADGSLANGDEIYYEIVNPTSGGGGKLFERGRGTLNTTTLQLTVTGVLERSAALASGGGWGAGIKDVLIVSPGAESVAVTHANNNFTTLQTFLQNARVSGVASATWEMLVAGMLRGRVYTDLAATVLDYINVTGVVKGRAILGDNTFQFYNGTTTRDVGLQESGNRIVQFPTGGVVKKIFLCAPPVNWNRINVVGQRYGRFAEAADSPEAQGGSWVINDITLNGTTDPVTLTVAQIPSHEHQFFTAPGGVGGIHHMPNTTANAASAENTTSVGGGGPHSHGLTSASVVSAGTWRPTYEIMVKASFN